MNRLIAVSFALVVVLSTQAFDCRQVFRTERMTRGNVGLRNVQDIDSAAWIGLEGARPKFKLYLYSVIKIRKELLYILLVIIRKIVFGYSWVLVQVVKRIRQAYFMRLNKQPFSNYRDYLRNQLLVLRLTLFVRCILMMATKDRVDFSEKRVIPLFLLVIPI